MLANVNTLAHQCFELPETFKDLLASELRSDKKHNENFYLVILLKTFLQELTNGTLQIITLLTCTSIYIGYCKKGEQGFLFYL